MPERRKPERKRRRTGRQLSKFTHDRIKDLLDAGAHSEAYVKFEDLTSAFENEALKYEDQDCCSSIEAEEKIWVEWGRADMTA